MSLAALLVAGCGGGGGPSATARTASPPDRLTVALEGGAYGAFRIDLDCAVVDRAACRDIIEALRRADEDETCVPADDDRRSIRITGTIDAEPVAAVLRRRTDCEITTYDAVAGVVR